MGHRQLCVALWAVAALAAAGCGDTPASAPPDTLGDVEPGSLDTSSGDGAHHDQDSTDQDSTYLDSTDQDALVDADPHNDSVGSEVGGVQPGDADAGPLEDLPPPEPPQLLLTVVSAPPEHNGMLPYSFNGGTDLTFTLRVNRELFTLDFIELAAGGPIDWATVVATCDQALTTTDGVLLEAGQPFGSDALEPRPTGDGMRLRMTPATAAPDGVVITCTADADGPGGTSPTSSIVFESAALPSHRDPFVEPDTWLVTLSRDIFALHQEAQEDGSIWLGSQHLPQGNGIPDLEEALVAMGIITLDNPEATEFVRSWLLSVIRAHAHRIFGLGEDGSPTGPDSVPIHLRFEGDDGAPTPTSWDGTFSMMALGGDGEPSDQEAGTVGRALIDWNNQGHEDDTVYGLGVFPTAVVRQVLAQPLGVLLLEPLLPDRGDPIGSLPGDAVFLVPDFDPLASDDDAAVERFTLLELAVDLGGLAIASTLCHEMGHSLGLVPPGAPPLGLFAQLPGLTIADNFVPGAHIDTGGLNVMQTGAVTNWLEALSQVPAFNPLNMAYLQRRLVVGEP